MFKRIFLFGLVNILVVVTLSAILHILGVGQYMTAYGIDYQQLAIFCLIWGMGGSFISLFLSKWMAKRFFGVQIVGPNGPYGQLIQTVHQLARKAGLEHMPEVGVYHGSEINAFATGAGRSSSMVAVSTGLLERMNQEQVEGVIGHEVAHIANGDMVTMTLLQGVVNAFVMFFARVAAFAVSNLLRGENDNARGGGLSGLAYMFVVMAFEMIFGLLGMMVVAWFSRYREYRADSGGAHLAGRQKMISALEALRANYEGIIDEGQTSNFNSLKISTRSSWFELFSTHPPLERRIQALSRRTYAN